MSDKNVKFETLHRKGNKKIIIFIIVFIFIGGLVLGINLSHAAFTSSFDVPFVRGNINYKHPDLKVMAMHLQDSEGSSIYNETTDMPNGSEYTINSSKSYCTKGVQGEKDAKVVLETVNGRHVIEKLTKNDRCYLCFDVIVKPKSTNDVLANYTISDSRSEEITMPFKESTPTIVYSKEDDVGTSYVFAGANPNNWVKMGNIYYRIIRFNGNGSMRLIYSGTGSAQTTGTGTQIGTNTFNISYNDNMYVGLQYTNGEVHGNSTNSKILGNSDSTDMNTLYGWYNNNIRITYGSLIDSSAGFCSDRDNYTDNSGTTSGGGTSTTTTYYGSYIRYLKGGTWQTTSIPTLKCKNNTDLLKLPVGLITADEYALAGGGGGSVNTNTNFWLYTSSSYWTMSPSLMNKSSNAPVFHADASGYLISGGILPDKYGLRPVINLKSTTIFEANGADGSSSKPWTVKI